MDLTLPDLLGLVLEARDGIPPPSSPLGVMIPEVWWNRTDLPFAALFGRCTKTGNPMLTVLTKMDPNPRDGGVRIGFLSSQFPSLARVDDSSFFTMSDNDYAAMRLVFGSGWE